MSLRLATHWTCGGLFLIDETAMKVINCLVRPTDYQWTDYVHRNWLDPDLVLTPSTLTCLPPPTGVIPSCFEFKGQTYVKKGTSKGFAQIRNVNNLENDSHDLAPPPSVEEEEEEDES